MYYFQGDAMPYETQQSIFLSANGSSVAELINMNRNGTDSIMYPN